jgi:flagellar basal-body rod modification protein FlgD
VIDPTTLVASSAGAGAGQASKVAKTAEGGPLGAGMSGLGRDAFLQLLVTQLGHQNPLKPQEDGEFIAQLAQFSSLEQLSQIQQTLAQMASALGVATPASTKS